MLKRFTAAAICLVAIWAISLERTYAWLGMQTAASARVLNAGMHPLSFDFTSSTRGDVRWQLIGQGGFGATIKTEPDGLHVQPTQNSFELRLNLAGARLSPRQVNALLLDLRPQRSNALLPKLSLAVHGALDDPGWIADSGNTQAAGAQKIDLDTLLFKREPTRLALSHWVELPPLTHLRLYGDTPTRAPFVLARVAFKTNQKIPSIALTGVRPEALLHTFDSARAGASITATDYRGPWFAPVVQMWISVISLTLVFVLLGFEFASEVAIHRARARALLVPAFLLPIITMLWGNADWPVDSGAVLAPQWLVLILDLVIAIGYRCINTPPQMLRLRFDAQAKAAWISCAVPTLAGAIVLTVGFAALPKAVQVEPHQHFGLLLALKYLAFAGFQQWLLQTLVWANLRRAALARWMAVLLSALLFALLHTPNFMLMLLCFTGALFWCGHYAKHRRLLPLILSHAFLGFLCVSIVPSSVLRSADIGVVYFLK